MPVPTTVHIIDRSSYNGSAPFGKELIETAYRVHNINSKKPQNREVELGSPVVHLDDDQNPFEVARSIGKALVTGYGDDDPFPSEPDLLYVDAKKAVQSNRMTDKAKNRIASCASTSGITVIALEEHQAHVISNNESSAGITSDAEARGLDPDDETNESRDARLKRLIEITKDNSPVIFLVVPEIIDRRILEF